MPHASQVTSLVESAGRDVGASGRDRLSGRGVLDVTRTLRRLGSALPARDRLEPNDGTRVRSRAVRRLPKTLTATVTRYEDALDVYRIRIAVGERVRVRLRGPAASRSWLSLWRPRTPEVGAGRAWRAAVATRYGDVQRLRYRAPKGGWYYAAVRGYGGAYSLSLAKR